MTTRIIIAVFALRWAQEIFQSYVHLHTMNIKMVVFRKKSQSILKRAKSIDYVFLGATIPPLLLILYFFITIVECWNLDGLVLVVNSFFMPPQTLTIPEIFYLWNLAMWTLKVLLNLRVLSQKEHGKERPSKCISTCSLIWAGFLNNLSQ